MKFGVFDHLDRNDLPLQAFYAERLKIVEAYDRRGFHAYHTAEHHATPLGLAASPSVFLAAVAQRTQKLRFGPLVYTLPLHHPLRLVEEICMKIYLETLQILRQALTSRTLTFHGEFYDYADIPMELEPFQKPHPPFWAGVGTPDGGESAGRIGFNMVANAPTAQVRAITDRYRAAFAGTHSPLLGLARFVIMGETDDEALAIARRAYPLWHKHFHHLFQLHGTSPAGGDRPPQFDQIKDGGRGIAGSPATVTRMIRSQMEEAGTNYFVGQFAFGDLTSTEVLRTIDLFAREVMPALGNGGSH